jgi:hypothetical protein
MEETNPKPVSVPSQAKETQCKPIPDRFTGLWEHCICVGTQGAQDLRKELRLDEVNFRHVASSAHVEPRSCYIYRVLDEVQKAAVSMMQWRESVEAGLPEKSNPNGEEAQAQRLTFETFIDDQNFRARKLTEALVDSILFSTTNDQGYYRDYYFLHDLNDCGRSQADRHEYFDFQSLNTKARAEGLLAQLQNLEQNNLDAKKRWYLENPGPCLLKWTTKGVPLSSFSKRYKAVIPLALPGELAILGKTYIHAYGTSRDVHFSPHDISSDYGVHEFLQGSNRVGLLILALIIRCQLLLNCVPAGVNKQWRDMHDGNAGPAQILGGLKATPAEVGDIVLAQGDLAEVLELKVSKYGYVSYRVKYLETPPLPEVPEDWFAVFEIRLVTKKALIDQAAAELVGTMTTPSGAPLNRDQILSYAKRGVIELYHEQQQQVRRAGLATDN